MDWDSRGTDPLALIQQQLDEVRRLTTLRVQTPSNEVCSFESAVAWYEAKLNATSLSSCTGAQSEGETEALLDSGASHPFRAPRSPEELQQARRVNVSLATGEGALLPQTSEGTLLAEGGDSAPIIPMGQLVTLLGCQIKWTQSKLVVLHPIHGRLQVRLRGNCPVLPVSGSWSKPECVSSNGLSMGCKLKYEPYVSKAVKDGVGGIIFVPSVRKETERLWPAFCTDAQRLPV